MLFSVAQVGSSDAENIDKSQDKLVQDLRKLCDRLKEEGFRVAYENWCCELFFLPASLLAPLSKAFCPWLRADSTNQ